jgi:hypothetical protein
MKPATSKKELQALLKRQGLDSKKLTARNVMETMLAFYTNQRAEGCDVTQYGDMLLYQWGIYDWDRGGPKFFLFDITRQFVLGEGEDDDTFQLMFTLHYPVTLEVQSIKAGNRWCHSPQQISEFETFIRNSEPYIYAAERLSEKVSIEYDCAG